jgi:hypothetical protein
MSLDNEGISQSLIGKHIFANEFAELEFVEAIVYDCKPDIRQAPKMQFLEKGPDIKTQRI